MSASENLARAERLLRAFAQYSLEHGPDEPVETNLVDFTADLIHLVCASGHSWITISDMAELHYEEETGGLPS